MCLIYTRNKSCLFTVQQYKYKTIKFQTSNHLLGSSAPKHDMNSVASTNSTADNMGPIHHAPTHRESVASNDTLTYTNK